MATNGKANTKAVQKLYEPYLEAEWGFVNHWYPVLFSHELGEDEVKGLMIAGTPIAVRRSEGVVYALKDQCLHRGVKLSKKPTCLTKDTLTCWYHGYTYDLKTGELVSIVAAPEDKIIGTTGITAYPTEEHAGLIFVFVKADDYEGEIPPLFHDLPIRFPENSERFPHEAWKPVVSPLDKNAVARGIRRKGNANWRLAIENSYDPGHLMIHKNNSIVLAKDWIMPLGIQPKCDEAVHLFEEEDGPKGFINMYHIEEYWDVVMENKRLNLEATGSELASFRTSVYLPGILMVEGWPEDGVTQYEWFVPITNDTYYYWEVLLTRCDNDKELEIFENRYQNLYKPMFLLDFNNNDMFARDSMHCFYADGSGWRDEQLANMDYSVIAWRKIAARYNRGVQRAPKGVDCSVVRPTQLVDDLDSTDCV